MSKSLNPNSRTRQAPQLFGQHSVEELVVPILADGSHERGTYLGSQLAREWDVPLRLVHVYRPDAEEAVKTAMAGQAAKSAADLCNSHPEMQVVAEVVENANIGMGVFSVASETALVCVATDQANEVLDPQSVGEQIAAESDAAVLLFGPHCTNLNMDGSVVVGLDGSRRAEGAIPTAIAFAEAIDSNVWLVNVIGPQLTAYVEEARSRGEEASESAYLREVAARYSGAPVPVEWEAIHGSDPIERLSGFAMTHESSVIVVAPHPNTPFTRGIFDSVSMGLAGDSPSPVLIVKSDKTPLVLTI